MLRGAYVEIGRPSVGQAEDPTVDLVLIGHGQ